MFDLQSNTYIDKRIERGYMAIIKVWLSDLALLQDFSIVK